MICALTLALSCLGTLAAEAPGPGWAHRVAVDAIGEEDAFLEAAFNHVVANGVKQAPAAQVIGDLNRYVHGVIASGGQVTLCLGLVVDVVKAANASKWTPEEASTVLLALQRDLDAGRPLEQLQQTVGRIHANATVAGVLAVRPAAPPGGKKGKSAEAGQKR